jgi:formamidopyrimidine-DNA glycosylase
MPELPEVETIRRGLERLMLGRLVLRARLLRADMGTAAGGRRPRPADLLQGDTVAATMRLGKQLALIGGTGRVVCIRLGMTGQVRRISDGQVGFVSHLHAVWQLDDGSTIGFRDPRRFGRVGTYADLDELFRLNWSRLGPDAAGITAGVLAERLQGSRRAVKSALLDQGVLAGVGNIYADESLFVAGVAPSRRAKSLSRNEGIRLARAIRTVLNRAIAARGSTLRDYLDADGLPGASQLTHAVYGRGGLPCIRCGTQLRRILIGQRTTVFCPICQRITRA